MKKLRPARKSSGRTIGYLMAISLVIGLSGFGAVARADLNDCDLAFSDADRSAPRTEAPVDSSLSQSTGQLDNNYLTTISSWTESWKSNLRHRLINDSFLSPLMGSRIAAPVDPFDPNFSIEDFHKARRYRSFGELQNRMMSELKDGPKIADARVKLLPDGKQALAAKLLAIRNAKRTIDLTYYIFNSDEAGQALIAELREAIRRGVSVRFMYDSAGSDKNAAAMVHSLNEFAAQNAGYTLGFDGKPSTVRATFEAMEFHPIGISSFYMLSRRIVRAIHNTLNRSLGLSEVDPLVFSVNRRTHDKILLIDGAFPGDAVIFTGGRNVGVENYDLANNGHSNNVDMEVMMRSASPSLEPPPQDPSQATRFEIGTEFQKYFDTLYFHLGNRRITRNLLAFATRARIALIDKGHESVQNKIGLSEISEEDKRLLINEGFSDAQVQVVGTFHNLYRRRVSRKIELADRKEIVKNGRALIKALEDKISQEDSEITISSPYLWMSPRQIRLMKAWLLKDPNRKLTIVVNSLMTTDNMLAQILVDCVIGPELMLDRGLVSQDGRLLRRSIASQVQIFEYGHADSTALGGTVEYGNLHMKAMLLKSLHTSVIGTYNGDPRSTLLNTEGMSIIDDPRTAAQLAARIEEIKAKSHLWGSEEYHQLRAHQELPLAKRIVAARMSFYYQLLLKLNLWWLL